MQIKFKEILLQESGLLSLSQSDCDLFLIGQTNAITYRQLALTGLHGNTATSGQLSVKRLGKNGYVTSRLLPENAREKYYILTAKGRKRLEKLLNSSFRQKMCFQLEKRPPLSQQQLPHRIHTGDIYFSYLSNKLSDRLLCGKVKSRMVFRMIYAHRPDVTVYYGQDLVLILLNRTMEHRAMLP